MKIIKWLDEHFEEYLLVILLVFIACIMMLQIIMRYFFSSSLSWAEEFTRYCFVWSVFISISYSIKRGSMLKIDAVTSLFPKVIQKGLTLIIDIVVLVFLVVMFYNSIGVVEKLKASGQTSPAMELPMYIVYFASLMGFGLGCIRSVQGIFKTIVGFFKTENNSEEVTQ